MQVSAKGSNGVALEVDFDFGSDLDAMAKIFGDTIVFEKAKASMVVALQGFIRDRLKAGDKTPEIRKKCDEWKPGLKKRGLSPAEKVSREIDKLPPDVKQALLKELATT